MRIYVDLDSLSVRDTPDSSAFSGITFKRATLQRLQVQFVQSGAAVAMLSGTTAAFGVKLQNQWEGPFLSALLGVSSNSVDGFFEGYLDTNTAEIDAALKVGDMPSDAIGSISAMAEIAWQSPGQSSPSRCNTFNININNCVITGMEGITTSANEWGANLPTSDPHVVGAPWNNGNLVMISTG